MCPADDVFGVGHCAAQVCHATPSGSNDVCAYGPFVHSPVFFYDYFRLFDAAGNPLWVCRGRQGLAGDLKSPGIGANPVPLVDSSGFYFDGLSRYLFGTTSVVIPDSFSLLVACRSDSAGPYQSIFGLAQPAGGTKHVLRRSLTNWDFVVDGAVGSITATPVTKATEMIVGTHEKNGGVGNTKIYLSGELKNSVSFVSTPISPCVPMVGRNGFVGSYFFVGNVYFVAYYDFALSPEQVNCIYQSSRKVLCL